MKPISEWRSATLRRAAAVVLIVPAFLWEIAVFVKRDLLPDVLHAFRAAWRGK